jgi:HEAT repeat protein
LSRVLAVGALSGLLGGAALAQQPNRRMKPAQTQPTPLGAAKDDEAASFQPPPASGLTVTAEESDRALLRGLLFAYEPAPTEIRVLAIEDLALLGDARALNVLAQLILDPNPLVQQASVRAVRAFQTPRAEEILENVIRHPRIADPLKLYALQSLPFQRSATAREFLQLVSREEERFGAQLAQAARNALQRAGDVDAPAPAPVVPPAPAVP